MRPSMRAVSVTPSRRQYNAPQTQIINLPESPPFIVRSETEAFKLNEHIPQTPDFTVAIKPNDKFPMEFPENPFQSNGGVSSLPPITISQDPMAKVEPKPPANPYKSSGGVSSLPELTISNDQMQLAYFPPKQDPYPATGGFAPQKWLLQKHKPMPTPIHTPGYDDPAEKVLLEAPPINVIVPEPEKMVLYGTWFSEFIRSPQLSTTLQPISAKSSSAATAAQSSNASIPIPPPFRNAERDVVIEQSSSEAQTPVVSEKDWDRYAEDPTPRLFGVRI